jgi:pyruvate,water dikinase
LREAVLRAMPHNVTTEMDLELWRMSRDIRAGGEALDAAPKELAARFHAGELAPVTQRALTEFLRRYGHRAVAEIDLGVPRWSDDPTHILGVLANYLRTDEDRQAPDAQFARAAAEAEEAVRRLTATAPWGRRRLVGFLLRRSRELIGLRESPKFLLVSADRWPHRTTCSSLISPRQKPRWPVRTCARWWRSAGRRTSASCGGAGCRAY